MHKHVLHRERQHERKISSKKRSECRKNLRFNK